MENISKQHDCIPFLLVVIWAAMFSTSLAPDTTLRLIDCSASLFRPLLAPIRNPLDACLQGLLQLLKLRREMPNITLPALAQLLHLVFVRLLALHELLARVHVIPLEPHELHLQGFGDLVLQLVSILDRVDSLREVGNGCAEGDKLSECPTWLRRALGLD
jgi:hypothetical protein